MQRRPHIRYPVHWTYKVIGTEWTSLVAAAAGTVGDREHTLAPSHESPGRRYVSLTLDVLVESEEARDALFVALGEHPDVRFVL